MLCRSGHEIEGTALACDKDKVRHLVATMHEAKVKHLAEAGLAVEMRVLACHRPAFAMGMSAVQTSEAVAPRSALEKLQTTLAWTHEDDVAGRESGWSLLLYASMRGDAVAVRELLAGGDVDLESSNRKAAQKTS